MTWLEENWVGPNLKTFAVKIAKRLDDRRDQIGTAAHGLGKDHIGLLGVRELSHLAH